MEKKATTGCLIGLVVVFVLMMVVALVMLNYIDGGRGPGEETVSVGREIEPVALPAPPKPVVEPEPEVDPRVVLVTPEDLDAYKRRKKGERVSIEHFVAARTDVQSTSLVKSVFKENAEGAPVRWELMVRDVSRVRGQLRGQFSVAYSYENERGKRTTNGTVSVHCEFAETTANELLDLQRGDWVVIDGKYSHEKTWPTIVEAKVMRESGE